MIRKHQLSQIAVAISLVCGGVPAHAALVAGVAVVVTDAAGVATLKETVASLPPRRSRREESRTVVTLPHGNSGGGHDHDDDDDDGD